MRNNPTIMKYLEGINFFGPYFSYCPPCGNKNLEFYKNLEQNQCLQIIQQIKKNKGRNIIFSEDKKNKKKNENNEEINDINKKHKNIKKDNQVMIKGNQYEGYYPRTPNLATPNYNKYHNYNININIENNNKHNPRKGNIKKTRPKTGSNIINNNSMNKKNKVNKVNLNLNVNNNNKK